MMYLSSRVDNFRSKILSLKPDHFAEGVLDCRVVALNEVAIDELHGQRGFAYMRGTPSVSIDNLPSQLVSVCPCAHIMHRADTKNIICSLTD